MKVFIRRVLLVLTSLLLMLIIVNGIIGRINA